MLLGYYTSVALGMKVHEVPVPPRMTAVGTISKPIEASADAIAIGKTVSQGNASRKMSRAHIQETAMSTRRQFIKLSTAALATASLPGAALAQAWPSRTDPRDGSVRGGQLARHRRTAGDGSAVDAARPADRDREPRRRRRHHRQRAGRQGRARRLHPAGPGLGAFGRARGLSEHRLRRRQGFHRRHPVRNAAERHGGGAVERHQDAEGPRRQGQVRADQLRVGRRRQRHPLGGRAHPRRRRLPGRARAVPRRARCAHRSHDRRASTSPRWACRRPCR